MTGQISAPGHSAEWAEGVLHFWFDELTRADWFNRSDALDQVIQKRFKDLHAELTALTPHASWMSARQSLAAVIVFDQFPRNMFRGTAQAFASDSLALQIARDAIAQGHDEALGDALAVTGRLFMYLPFEHSEDLADQDLAVALISKLGDDEFTRYAIAHRDIIVRFGRFPHRNKVLGRPSTAEETAFLTQPGSSF